MTSTQRRIRPQAKGTAAKTEPVTPARTVRQIPNGDNTAVKVDRMWELQKKIDAAKAKYKTETEAAEKEVATIKKELLEKARETQTLKFTGTLAIFQVSATTKRTIDPRKFLAWLKKSGQVSQFFGLISVGITETLKTFGEKILDGAGVLTTETDKFGNGKLMKRPD